VCGIIGILCKLYGSKVFNKPLGEIIKESLINLEYRGYDSVGFAIIDPFTRELVIKKSKGKIREVERRLGFSEYDGTIAIGHTRWATHGKPSDINAHPHVDCTNTIAIVHNGIIHNYMELKKKLIAKGHVFKSETDTEVVPHLIEEYLKQGLSFLEALRKVVRELKGAYALALISIYEPDKIYFVRNVSPLIIGLSDKALFIASDIPAFLQHTNKVIILEDGDFGYISPTEIYIENVNKGVVDWKSKIRIIDWTPEMAMKAGYPHYMLKEIHEQPIALKNTLASLGNEVDKVSKLLLDADRIFLTGAGTSFHAALAGEYLLNFMAGLNATAFISSEYMRFRKVFREDDVLIAVSQSGETIDTLMAVREARKKGVRIIALSNILDSAIPRESDISIYTRAGPEIGVAATKTFTTQLLVFVIIACRLAELTEQEDKSTINRVKNELKNINTITQAVTVMYEPFIRKFSERLARKTNAFYLGRGLGVPISMEGALKLKEIAYIHAEAYPAGESKHGPIALVEKDFPVFFTIFDDELKELILGNIEEMKARGALTIGLIPKGFEQAKEKLDVVFEMPRLTPYTAIIPYIIPYQLIAYYTSVARGYDPDRPRNLAKTVTVE